MKKIFLSFLKNTYIIFIGIFALISCEKKPVLNKEVKKINKEKETKYISIKYKDDLVNIYKFESYDTSRSSFIREAYYDERNKYLILKLKKTYYHYCSFPESMWQRFKSASSYSSFYIKNIKERYLCNN